MLERTDATTNEVLEPITFVLAYPTVLVNYMYNICTVYGQKLLICLIIHLCLYIYTKLM